MKLTNYMRDAFVSRVMNDVPQVDHDEAIRKALNAAVLKHTPKEVMKLFNSEATRAYVQTTTYYAERVGVVGPLPKGFDWTPRKEHRKLIEDDEAVAAIVTKKKAQDEARETLERRLKGMTSGVSTRKQLAEALPEFEKYLPADESAAIRSLPVVANVVAEFVKAGWPKDKKVKAAA